MEEDRSITQLIEIIKEGEGEAFDELFAEAYDELKRVAHNRLRRMGPGETLSTTALVNEAYVKLASRSELQWRDRTHFFASTAQLMRNLLVDYARQKNATKRGGELKKLDVDLAEIPGEQVLDNAVELDRALRELEEIDARVSQVAIMKVFGGMSNIDIGDALKVSEVTVKRDWNKARAFLADAV